jgi:hypothetical protein
MPRSPTGCGCIASRTLNLSSGWMSTDSRHRRFNHPQTPPVKISRYLLVVWGRKKYLQFPGTEFRFPRSAARPMFIVATEGCVSVQQHTKTNLKCDSNCELVRVLIMYSIRYVLSKVIILYL